MSSWSELAACEQSMSLYLNYTFASICVLAPLSFALWLIHEQQTRRRKEEQILRDWHRSSARVTRVVPHQDEEHELLQVHVSYTIEGLGEIQSSYTHSLGPGGEDGPKPGEELEVLVNPEDPEEFLTRADLSSWSGSRSCWGCTIITFLVTSAAMAFAFFKAAR